jgi:hypothetical protein
MTCQRSNANSAIDNRAERPEMGLPMIAGEMRVFKEMKGHVLVSAKVYIPGQPGLRLVTTFYTYLQLTP